MISPQTTLASPFCFVIFAAGMLLRQRGVLTVLLGMPVVRQLHVHSADVLADAAVGDGGCQRHSGTGTA